jgi:iron-sulfur cluster protein
LAHARAALIAKVGRLVRNPVGAVRSLQRHIKALDQRVDDPMIIVRVPSSRAVVVCRIQGQAGEFADALTRLPQFSENRLLRALERAVRLETYEAADLLFHFATAAAAGVEATVQIGNAKRPHRRHTRRAIASELARKLPHRLAMLADLFDASLAARGNDLLRLALIEALALALSRALGKAECYAAAESIVSQALALGPASIHLKSAKHALYLKRNGQQVPERLSKFIGDDNGYLRQFVCPLPFERFDIGPNGDVLVCCGHWLPTSIGNFLKDGVDDVLNSPKALKIRESVTDGSYKYCNHLECGAMIQGTLPRRERSPYVRATPAHAEHRIEKVHEAMFALDQTCNLSCPSCRRERIVERMSDSIEKTKAVEEKLIPLLSGLRVLNINPAGELFASKPSRRILELINDERCPELVLDIISNGTLFSEAEWNKFPGIHNKIRSIRISTDAARRETFEKLRRLGKYDVFIENMRFLSRLRASGAIPQLKFSFTYQLDNFREMREFVDFCASMNADFAIFERLQNLGTFAPEDYAVKAVHHPSHPRYRAFIEVIKDPIFRSRQVWHDFDFPGVDKMSSEEAVARLSN